MPSLSDQPKSMGQILKSLRLIYPDFTWSSKLHSNMIRGKVSDENCYTIMIVYFQMRKVFEVSIRGVDVNCLAQNTDCIDAVKELEEQLIAKKKTIEKIIEELTKKRLEE